MKCLSPLYIKNNSALTDIGEPLVNVVPCGKCFHCLLNNRSAWSHRLFQEACHSQSSHFVTFTYDDDHLFFDPVYYYAVLEPTYIKRWLKNLVQLCRDRYDVVVKYYLCGEYGWKTGRPHYHLHLFNLPNNVDLWHFFSELWLKGNFFLDATTAASCAYTSKHNLLKLLDSDLNPNYDVEQIVPPFRLMSKSLGKCYVDDILSNYVVDFPTFLVNEGRRIPFPRYYKDKIEQQISYSKHFDKRKNYLRNYYFSKDFHDKLFRDDTPSFDPDRDIPYLVNHYKLFGYKSLEEFNKHLSSLSIDKKKSMFDSVKYTIDNIYLTFKNNTKL